MGLNIKNAEVERLAAIVAGLARESKTDAIHQALTERKARLEARSGKLSGRRDLRAYLERHVWPLVPPGKLGRAPTRREVNDILGFGPKGF